MKTDILMMVIDRLLIMDKQYEHESLNQQDLFQEYIDSLPEEGEEKPEEERTDSPGLSEQVERDLLDYKAKGYDKQTRKTSSRSRSRRAGKSRKKNGAPVAAIAVLTAGIALTITGLTATMIARNSYSSGVEYTEPYYEEYEDPWQESYSQMSGSLSQPEAIVDGYYVSLPVSVSDFMQDEWRIRSSAFSEVSETVGAEPQTFQVETEWGNHIAEISVVSPTGEEVALNDALITGISFDSSGAWTELNGGISTGSGTWTIETALNEEGVEWVKRGNEEGSRYIIESSDEFEYGYDEYVLRLELQDDYVERIVMQLSQSEQMPESPQ